MCVELLPPVIPPRATSAEALWDREDRTALLHIQRALDSGSLLLGRPPEGCAFRVWPSDRDCDEAASLVAEEPWNRGRTSSAALAQGVRGALAWVGVRYGRRLVATAQAVGDGQRIAWVQNVCVHREHRGLGYGRAVVQALLAHPAVRCVDVCLSTATAEGFYQKLGFVTSLAATLRAPAMMILRRRVT